MDWRAVRILYTRELRSALRERTIVVNSILMPVFLYPVLLWVMFTALSFVEGLEEGFTSRIVVVAALPAHRELLDSLEARDDVEMRIEELSAIEAVALIQEGELDARVEFLPPANDGTALADNFRVQIHYDRAVERSNRARIRVDEEVAAYRRLWVEREALALGIAPEDQEQFAVAGVNVSTERQMGGILLGSMVPLFLVIMVAVGCFVPAVDTTAGERERSTWETLMTVSAPRLSIVVAKYLYVATLGIMAGVLNVVAIFISIGAVIRPLLADIDQGFSFTLPLAAIPVMVLGAIALALFFAAAMMVLAAFARTFKDGQAMVMPAYWLALLPLLLGQQTERHLDPLMASIPVANVALMIRDAITGVFLWPYIAQTLVVTLVFIALCLLMARSFLGFEDFIVGSYDGSMWRFLKDRILRGNGHGERDLS